MKRLAVAALVFAFVGTASVRAADDPTGTWKWTVSFGEKEKAKKFDVTLKLKLEGEKLTGAIAGREGKDFPISDAKFAGGEISFKVVREGKEKGKSFVSKYTGKLSGDTIKGKTESEFGGKSFSRDWEAKRVKE